MGISGNILLLSAYDKTSIENYCIKALEVYHIIAHCRLLTRSKLIFLWFIKKLISLKTFDDLRNSVEK